MKHLLSILSILFCLIVQTAGAETVVAAKVSDDSIQIDAVLDDWKLKFFADENKILLNPKTASTIGGTIKDADDCSVTIYAAYDSDYLYLAVEATDDKTYAEQAGATIWQNDGMEIWIDGGNNAGVFPGEEDNYQLVTDSNGATQGYRNTHNLNDLVNGVENAAERDGTNYKLEVKIPLQHILQLDLANGIGFNITIVDADAARAAGGWSRLFWQGDVDTDTANWGDLLFGEPLAVEAHGKLAATWGYLKLF